MHAVGLDASELVPLDEPVATVEVTVVVAVVDVLVLQAHHAEVIQAVRSLDDWQQRLLLDRSLYFENSPAKSF